jgi:hypothetical protein
MTDQFPEDDDLTAAVPVDVDDEYEEISSDEVDRMVEALEALAATAESENVRYLLEEATLKIYLLVYGDEDIQSEAA